MNTEFAVERYEFSCARCGARWISDYDVQYVETHDGEILQYYSLNGTRTRGWPAGRASSAEPKLRASSSTTNHTNHRERCGGRGAGASGIPLPSGAGATRQPRLSRGIPASA